jgi:hypothetical protein
MGKEQETNIIRQAAVFREQFSEAIREGGVVDLTVPIKVGTALLGVSEEDLGLLERRFIKIQTVGTEYLRLRVMTSEAGIRDAYIFSAGLLQATKEHRNKAYLREYREIVGELPQLAVEIIGEGEIGFLSGADFDEEDLTILHEKVGGMWNLVIDKSGLPSPELLLVAVSY